MFQIWRKIEEIFFNRALWVATNIIIWFVIVYKELFIIGVCFIDQHKGCKQQSLIKGIKPYNALFDHYVEEILKL